MGFFDNADKAFEAFYDEHATFETRDGLRQDLSVCVFYDVEGDPINEEVSIDSEVKQISVIARKQDWCFCKKLKRGDDFTVTSTQEKYKVSSVKNDAAMGIVIRGRQI